ncbi:hypothetical protein BpHYR1_000973 [Brachionus plicatilis]|uniref:Uncharacterized protein n=1 Tax=Brachionus plicatilis TaxID=10195 RepID=A0A3M7T3E4_BRAPC|nr:hypothetical protein BpHYR1_000973 [Brachionus plicatilis]
MAGQKNPGFQAKFSGYLNHVIGEQFCLLQLVHKGSSTNLYIQNQCIQVFNCFFGHYGTSYEWNAVNSACNVSGCLTLKPGMDSSLSSVPPVKPRPRPLIIGILRPHAAKAGAKGSEILSPTPPVLCLSTTKLRCFLKLKRAPLFIIESVM